MLAHLRSRIAFPILALCLSLSLPALRALAEETPLLKVERSLLRDHIGYLASDELIGRDSGEAGLEVAAEYIANIFESYGLEPAGDNGTFFQHFTVPSGAAFARETGARVQLRGGTELRWNAGTDVDAFGFGKPGALEAPVVFAGYGITTNARDKERGLEWDDYAGIDVKGKVVIVLRFTPESEGQSFGGARSPHAPFVAKLSNAEKHGAAGVIFVTPSGHPDEDPYGIAHRAAPRQPTLPALYASRSAVNLLLRAHGTTVSRLVSELSSGGKPKSFELEGTKIQFSTTRRHLRLRNVAARLKGSDPELSRESLVIGGHYDHIGRFGNQVARNNLGKIHNGADDNASGTAGIIEIARLLSQGELPRRSVDFVCFSGEEIGLLGSRFWVNDAPRQFVLRELTLAKDTPPNPHGSAKGGGLVWEAGTHAIATGRFEGDHVQVRTLSGSTGWVDANALEQVAGPTPMHRVVAMINLDMIGRGKNDKPVQVLGATTSKSFGPMLESISRAAEQPLAPGRGMSGGGSDHFHFQRKRVPYLFFFTGMHAQYNKPDDDLETINLDVQTRIVECAWRSALHIANAAERPAFDGAAANSPHGGGAQDRPMLGILSDGEFVGKGVRITETVNESPAGNSELRPGDVIIAFGEKTIETLSDLREALSDRPQGDVPLKVLREGKERMIVVKFPRRGGFRVSFGSVPDYAFAEKGVRFEDIRPNTPAAKGGVKPGDVLLSWNGETVQDVEHWTRLLGQRKPGDKVKIVVARGEKKVELTVTLEGR